MKNLYGSNIGSYFFIIKILKVQGHTYNEFTFCFFVAMLSSEIFYWE